MKGQRKITPVRPQMDRILPNGRPKISLKRAKAAKKPAKKPINIETDRRNLVPDPTELMEDEKFDLSWALWGSVGTGSHIVYLQPIIKSHIATVCTI